MTIRAPSLPIPAEAFSARRSADSFVYRGIELSPRVPKGADPQRYILDQAVKALADDENLSYSEALSRLTDDEVAWKARQPGRRGSPGRRERFDAPAGADPERFALDRRVRARMDKDGIESYTMALEIVAAEEGL